MEHLPIELRSVATDQRVVTLVVAPYGETSYLTDSPGGERFQPGAFAGSLRGREKRVKLLRGHDQRGNVYGISRTFRETPDGLVGEFEIRTGADGDQMLEDLRSGLFDLSCGFQVEKATRGPGGIRIIERARLYEVSAVAVGVYSDARVLATRSAYHHGDRDIASTRSLEPWQRPRRWL